MFQKYLFLLLSCFVIGKQLLLWAGTHYVASAKVAITNPRLMLKTIEQRLCGSALKHQVLKVTVIIFSVYS